MITRGPFPPQPCCDSEIILAMVSLTPKVFFFSNDKTAHSLLSPLTSNKMKKYLLYKYEILAL